MSGLVRLGVPDAEYRAAQGLSQSAMKALLPPSCPAKFRWERDNGRPGKATFDFGHAAHRMILGTGVDVRVIPDEVTDSRGGWTTTAAKALVAEARKAGETPIKPADWQTVQAMADTLRAQVGDLFDPDAGDAEVSLFWDDEVTGLPLKARLDFVRHGERVFLLDLKTATSANPWKWARDVAGYGYDVQAAHYTDGAIACGIADAPEFVFVVQEKTPPYVASVVILTPADVDQGRAAARRAIDLYAECVATDTWPAYTDDITYVSLPPRWDRDREQAS